MMQEEDCLDFAASSDNMAGVDVSFGDVDCSGPTLLMAVSASNFDAPESTETTRREGIANKDVEVAKNASIGTDENVNGSSKVKESEGGLDDTMLTNETSVGNIIEKDDSSRVKELFGQPDDGESFGAIEKQASGLSTASVLFANGDTPESSDLFPRDDRADSFSKLMSNNVNEGLNMPESQRKSEQNALNIDSVNASFQGLDINTDKAAHSPSPTLPPQFPGYPSVTMTESSQFTPGTYNSVNTSPPVSSMPMPVGINSFEPSQTSPGTQQYVGQTQVYPGTQNQIPMYYNPGNQQHNQGHNNTTIEHNSSPDVFQPQNGANVGNSYMYTAPIASILPNYEPSQGNQMPQKPAGTRLHQSHVPKQAAMPAGELFVPDLYGHSTAPPSSQVNIFTPSPDMVFEQQNLPQNIQQMGYGAQNMPNSNYDPSQNQYGTSTAAPYSIQDYQQYANERNFYPGDSQDPGFWEWVKNQDWSEGAQKLGKQLLQKTKCTIKWVGSTVIDHATKAHVSKNATDTVLTTLDPGMEEYLSPSIHLAVASQDSKILQAVRQGFKHIFGHTAAKGHSASHSLPVLPIGFDFGGRAVVEQLDRISTIDFKFSQPYIHVALQPFLTELQQGRWSCMYCLAVRDCSRRIQLQAYSQPISIPSACMSIAYSRASQQSLNCGFDVSIDELVRLFKPYTGDEDWCSTLNGIAVETIISLASQGLAAEYKRELESSSLTQNDSFVVLPS